MITKITLITLLMLQSMFKVEDCQKVKFCAPLGKWEINVSLYQLLLGI